MEENEYKDKLLLRVIAALKERSIDRTAVSVILTGSMSLGEETYHNGRLLSDVELVVVPRPPSFRVRKTAKQTERDFSEDINIMPLSRGRVIRGCNFNGSVLRPRFHTVFTRDLYDGAVVLWGEDVLAKSRVRSALIDPYEAKRLVANRIGDLLLSDGWRLRCKLMLAVADAALILEGRYVTSAKNRARLMEERQPEVLNGMNEAFWEDFRGALGFLRLGGGPFDVPTERLRGYVKVISEEFDRLGLDHSSADCLSRKLKFFIKYVRAGGGKGFIGAEDRILSSLIKSFAEGGADKNTARLWKLALY